MKNNNKENLLIDLFKSLRIQKNYTQKDISKKLGLKTHSSYNHKDRISNLKYLEGLLELKNTLD